MERNEVVLKHDLLLGLLSVTLGIWHFSALWSN